MTESDPTPARFPRLRAARPDHGVRAGLDEESHRRAAVHVAHRSAEHSALAVANRVDHRLVVTRAVGQDPPMRLARRIGVRRGQDRHISRRPALGATALDMSWLVSPSCSGVVSA